MQRLVRRDTIPAAGAHLFLFSSGRVRIGDAEETQQRIVGLFGTLREKYPSLLCFLMYLAEKTGVTHAATSNFEKEADRATRYAEEFGGVCQVRSAEYDTLCRRKFYVRQGSNHGPPIAEPLFDDDKSSRLIRLTQAGLKVVMYLRGRPSELARLKATFGKAKPKLTPPFTSKPTDKVQYGWTTATEMAEGKTQFAGRLSFPCLKCGNLVEHAFAGCWPDERFSFLLVRCGCGLEWAVALFEPNHAPIPNGE